MFSFTVSGLIVSQYATKDGKRYFVKLQSEQKGGCPIRPEERIEAEEYELSPNIDLTGIGLRARVEISGYGYQAEQDWRSPTTGVVKPISNTRLVATQIKTMAAKA